MDNQKYAVTYEHSDRHMVCTSATKEQLDKIKEILSTPKPLLSDAQVGWVVKLENGKYSTITEINETDGMVYFRNPEASPDRESADFICDLSGNTEPWGKVADIIHTEPLASEGTAEWRNQMLLLGYSVIQSTVEVSGIGRKTGDNELTATMVERNKLADEYYTWDKAKDRIIGRVHPSGEFNSTWNKSTFFRDDSTGWQIYEPAPRLKVGDIAIIKTKDGKIYHDTICIVSDKSIITSDGDSFDAESMLDDSAPDSSTNGSEILYIVGVKNEQRN